MTMKKTDLEKRLGSKLENRRRHAAAGNKFGQKSAQTGQDAEDKAPALNPRIGALLGRGLKDGGQG